MDINAGKLLLTFNEPVLSDSVNVSQLTIQSVSNGSEPGAFTLTLTGGTAGSDSTVMEITLTQDDLDFLKANNKLATNSTNTYVSFTDKFITDTAHETDENMVVAEPLTMGFPVTEFINDSTAPTLVEYQFTLNFDQIILKFDEPMLTSSLTDLTLFSFQNNRTGPTITVNLTGGDVVTQSNGVKQITIMLLDSDVTTLKLNNLIGSSASNTFLTIEAGAIEDMNNFPLGSVGPVEPSALVPDSSRPTLRNFSLDMDNGRLNLTFDDVMDVTMFDSSAFRIQHRQRKEGDIHYTLQSSTTSSSDSYEITVSFSDQDFFGIKKLSALARNVSTSWLTMQAFAIDDVDGIDVIAVTDGKALQARAYVTDDTPPSLTSFSLDLDEGQLRLTFNDFIDETSLLITSLSITNNGSTDDTLDPSADGIVTRSDDGKTAILTLPDSDLNVIKNLTALGTNVNNTYLVLTSGAIEDLFANVLTSGGTFKAADVIADNTSIELTDFIIDLNTGNLTLIFSETYNSSTFNITAITIQGLHDATAREDS
uniref:Uncharacterized protein n=1 Tax=Amphimedon queenslandica TaxID=400682 RepID=A0A1X7SNL2_AMPQE